MARGSALAFLATGLLLAGLAVVDLVVFPGSFLSIVYIVPLAIAALLLPPPAVALFGAAGFALGAFSVTLAETPLAIRSVRLVGLAMVAAFVVMLALERQRSRRAASEAEDSRRRLMTVLESITDAFFTLDTGWRFTYINHQAEQILQRRGEDLLGRVVWEEFPEAVDTTFWQQYHRAMSEGVTVGFQEYYLPLERWVEVRAYPSSQGLSVYFRDITEQKEAEEQRERLLQEREEMVQIVSHDLRNPLTAVQGQAQLLQRSLGQAGRDEPALRSADAILVGVRRMTAMLQDLTDSARLETGQLALSPTRIDLRTLLMELRGRMAGVLATERVRVEVANGLPEVWADPNRLDRILTNLLANGLKYSQEEVVVTAHRQNDCVELSVIDRGPGISDEDRVHLFERFYRVQGTRKLEGLGLGLYISRMLVEAMGGEIWVESRMGEGSSFNFTLPVAR